MSTPSILASRAKYQSIRERDRDEAADYLARFRRGEFDAVLRSHPHPHETPAAAGKTLREYVEFCFRFSGERNAIRIIREKCEVVP